jgi:hypothetical protein
MNDMTADTDILVLKYPNFIAGNGSGIPPIVHERTKFDTSFSKSTVCRTKIGLFVFGVFEVFSCSLDDLASPRFVLEQFNDRSQPAFP